MLTDVEGKIYSKQYVEFMDSHLPQSTKDLRIPLEEAIFQQDSDPECISKLAQTWFSLTISNFLYIIPTVDFSRPIIHSTFLME